MMDDLSVYLPDLAGKVHISAGEFEKIRAALLAVKPFVDGFTYNPGHSDLDNEQPIHITVTLGDWRKLNWALSGLR